MGYNKILTDEGSRKDDERIAEEMHSMSQVHITLQALAATLSNITQ